MTAQKETLHEHEKQLLLALTKKMTQEELTQKTNLKKDSVMHACLWLHSKGLVKIHERREVMIGLSKEGERYLENGLPEENALEVIGKGCSIGELKKQMGDEPSRIAITWLLRKNLAKISNGKITPSGKRKPENVLSSVKTLIKQNDLNQAVLKTLQQRRKLIREIENVVREVELTTAGKKLVGKGIRIMNQTNTLTPALIGTGKWKTIKLRKYDITAPVPSMEQGKRHFAKQSIEYIRRVWLDMGFKEMQGPLVNSSFWNFDALFTAQDHPVREMQDTFFVEPEDGGLPDKKLVARVKKAHEQGVCGSTGWQYKWDPEVAKKNVLRTHTTVLSARTLAALKKDDLPAKYFSIGRCFRNEAMDWKHLFEFNQIDGIVVDENANFKHLLGYLKEFFGKLGFERARFRPAYFPYTELSLEVDVLAHDGKWMELGGAGIFRPEVVEPLLGKDIPVLAWGPGIGRIMMEYYGIRSLRDLYSNDVKQMREMKQWMW